MDMIYMSAIDVKEKENKGRGKKKGNNMKKQGSNIKPKISPRRHPSGLRISTHTLCIYTQANGQAHNPICDHSE